MKTAHPDLLNALDLMGSSLYYAVRRHVIRQAEELIVSQEQRIADLEEQINVLESDADAAIETWTGCTYYEPTGGEVDIGEALANNLLTHRKNA